MQEFFYIIQKNAKISKIELTNCFVPFDILSLLIIFVVVFIA